MEPVRAGRWNPPPELAGRAPRPSRGDAATHRAAQSLILVGLRGVGKTVVLVRIRTMAEALGYRTAFVEAHEGKMFRATSRNYLG